MMQVGKEVGAADVARLLGHQRYEQIFVIWPPDYLRNNKEYVLAVFRRNREIFEPGDKLPGRKLKQMVINFLRTSILLNCHGAFGKK